MLFPTSRISQFSSRLQSIWHRIHFLQNSVVSIVAQGRTVAKLSVVRGVCWRTVCGLEARKLWSSALSKSDFPSPHKKRPGNLRGIIKCLRISSQKFNYNSKPVLSIMLRYTHETSLLLVTTGYTSIWRFKLSRIISKALGHRPIMEFARVES